MINCDGTCAYEPTPYPVMAETLERLLQRYSKKELAVCLNRSISWINELLEKGKMKHIISGRVYAEGSLLGAKFMVHEQEGKYLVDLMLEGNKVNQACLRNSCFS